MFDVVYPASSAINPAGEDELHILKPHFHDDDLGYGFHVDLILGADVVDFNLIFDFSNLNNTASMRLLIYR